jgi:lysophospholipase-3
LVALEFVRNSPSPWRHKFIKHLFMVAPTWSGGYVRAIRGIVSGPPVDMVYVPSASRLSVRSMWRTFETAIVNLPSPEVFGRRPLLLKVFLTGKEKNRRSARNVFIGFLGKLSDLPF